jgi:hypothetical protein
MPVPGTATPLGMLKGDLPPHPIDHTDSTSQGFLGQSWLRDGRGLAAAVVAALLGTTLLQRFGLTLGPASLHAAVLGIYGVLLMALMGSRLALSGPRAALVAAFAAWAALSLVANDSHAFPGQGSLLSWVLLLVMYLPFAFVLRPGGQVDTAFLMRCFSVVVLLAAWAGIAQFAAQFVIRADWLFNFSPYLPPVLRSADGYNVVIAVGERVKSNGFFFKEPSLFSIVLALGLLLEIATHKRWWRLAPMALALALTYSGSGLLVLAVGLLFPLRLQTFLRLGVAAAVAGVIVFALWDLLNLGFTLGRIDEFSNPRSSAYERYVAPTRLLLDSMGAHPWTLWTGHGPGTITRLGDTSFYTFHDPTWAKAIFEYGLVGFALVVTLALLSLRNREVPIQVRAGAFFCWLLTGGFLLTPEALYLMPLLSGLVVGAVPARSRSASASPAGPAASA